ncbi:MAG: hypothetical protein MUC59_15220 [Saprospiraceae bacterium]|jgi:hypothetical protein|nr:hypothetical protein [Saprospiraceae bacterium]
MYKILFILLVCANCLLSSCFTVAGTVIGGNIAEERNKQRPTRLVSKDLLDTLAIDTPLELVRKQKKTVYGHYVGTDEFLGENGTLELVLVLDIKGTRKHLAVSLADIEYMKIGVKTNKPKNTGTAIGAVIDVAGVTVGVIALVKIIRYIL